jgi:hypothetical protein
MRSVSMTVMVLCGLACAGTALAQDSVQNGSNAAKASTEVVKDLGASGVQTASAVAVLPLSVAGTGSVVAGTASTATGVDASHAAGASAAFASTPLPVTKKVIVAQPVPKLPYDAKAAEPPKP